VPRHCVGTVFGRTWTARNRDEERQTRGWLVPHYWTNKYPKEGVDPSLWAPGGDCFSGAVFTNVAVHMTGIPGTIESKNFMSKSPPGDPYTAVEWVGSDPARRRTVDRVRQVLTHFDGGGNANQFEATVIYSDGTNTYYFPSGIPSAPVFGNANHVLSVFVNFGWAKREGAGWVLVEELANWTMRPAPRINLYE
jgi:hypothetical protein